MSAEQDSVRRLAEADAHALREQAEAWAEEHYLHDSVGAFEAGWEARQPAIDSLTAERDHERHRKEVAEFEREEVRAALTRAIEAADSRAEAAEAREARLRDALVEIRAFQYDDRLTSASAYSMCRIADAALATPPSEGGQS